jgi:hypothetical protein
MMLEKRFKCNNNNNKNNQFFKKIIKFLNITMLNLVLKTRNHNALNQPKIQIKKILTVSNLQKILMKFSR